MILTDTPRIAFDKVAIDIVGPLTAKARHNYILIVQDLTKFLVAIPLKQTTVIHVY
jgi:hypothetical protein